MTRVLLSHHALGDWHDWRDNRKLAVGHQDALGLPPDFEQLVEVRLVRALTYLTIDPVVNGVPVGRAWS